MVFKFFLEICNCIKFTEKWKNFCFQLFICQKTSSHPHEPFLFIISLKQLQLYQSILNLAYLILHILQNKSDTIIFINVNSNRSIAMKEFALRINLECVMCRPGSWLPLLNLFNKLVILGFWRIDHFCCLIIVRNVLLTLVILVWEIFFVIATVICIEVTFKFELGCALNHFLIHFPV